MGVAELEQQHLKLFGEEPASAHRQFLFRKIAWRLQADREGGLPESARELARAIAKDAPLRNRVISNAGKQRARWRAFRAPRGCVWNSPHRRHAAAAVTGCPSVHNNPPYSGTAPIQQGGAI